LCGSFAIEEKDSFAIFLRELPKRFPNKSMNARIGPFEADGVRRLWVLLKKELKNVIKLFPRVKSLIAISTSRADAKIAELVTNQKHKKPSSVKTRAFCLIA
jgi:hypothetical protein